MEKLTRHARVDVADVLRGLAVLGIILLHSIEHFNFYAYPEAAGRPEWLVFCDRAIWDGLFFTLGGKAYAVFALLFGFSFFIMDDNQRMRGNDFRARFCWRLLLLFIIGNINAMFFTGEVLVLYALMGFVLVLTCRLSTKLLIWIAAICLLQPLTVINIVRAAVDPSFVFTGVQNPEHNVILNNAHLYAGFWEMAKVNLLTGQIWSLAWAWDNGRMFQTAALFIMGMLIGRNGWFLKEHMGKWVVAGMVAAACFFPLTGINNMLPAYIDNANLLDPMQQLLTSLSKMAFMVMLVSAVLYLYYNTRVRDLLQKIIPYGKMSMTNYVTQGIIGSFIYYGWGLGMYDKLGITESLLLGVLIFVLQWMFCRWWLGRFSHGPMEGAWRKLTWIRAKS